MYPAGLVGLADNRHVRLRFAQAWHHLLQECCDWLCHTQTLSNIFGSLVQSFGCTTAWWQVSTVCSLLALFEKANASAPYLLHIPALVATLYFLKLTWGFNSSFAQSSNLPRVI